jgi:hypothetical protein
MVMSLKQKIIISVFSIPVSLLLFQNTGKVAESYCLKRNEILQFCGTPHTIVSVINVGLSLLGVVIPTIYLVSRLVIYAYRKSKLLGIGILLLLFTLLVVSIIILLARPWHLV